MSKVTHKKSGIYIVTLNTELPMPVTRDKRYVDICAKVDNTNVKIGKAKNLAGRVQNYWKDFDKENVNFTPIALLEEIVVAEGLIKKKLVHYRMNSPKGGKLEWLAGIDAEEG